MKIIKLQAENVKKLKAIEIKPDSNLVQITGANAQGKTSVLDSIWYGLGGKDNIGSKPIRDGEDKAIIKLDLGDFIVTRKFKRKGDDVNTTLLIESKDGLKYKSPQTMLDALVGKLSFDPLAFANLKPKEQFSLLCDICDIDFDFENTEDEKKAIYAERTVINRQLKELEAEQNNIDIDIFLPEEEVNIQELVNELQEIKEYNATQIVLKDDIIMFTGKVKALKEELSDTQSYLKKLTDSQEQLKDDAEIAEKLEKAQDINNNYAKIQRQEEIKTKAKVQHGRSDEKSKHLAKLEADKKKALKTSKMPIVGLTIDNNEVFYDKIPFEQLSGSEKLKISLAIAAATNPKLRVIRIADGSLLDKNSMNELLDFANHHDFQIWIERVDESGKVGICIEDGAIKD